MLYNRRFVNVVATFGKRRVRVNFMAFASFARIANFALDESQHTQYQVVINFQIVRGQWQIKYQSQCLPFIVPYLLEIWNTVGSILLPKVEQNITFAERESDENSHSS